MDPTPIHVTCKFARHYGKDCKSEVYVNLDFRMPSMISEMAVVLVHEHLSKVHGNLLTFQDIRRLEQNLSYSVCSFARSQEIFD